jgi:hypothetical protein
LSQVITYCEGENLFIDQNRRTQILKDFEAKAKNALKANQKTVIM